MKGDVDMFQFVDVVGYTTSKSNKVVILNGMFEITETFRCGRTKVEEVDGNTYWIDSSLDQVGIMECTSTEEHNPEESEKYEEPTTEPSESEKDRKPIINHVVKRGETVQSIAQMYDVYTSWLISHIGSNSVHVGQHIVIY